MVLYKLVERLNDMELQEELLTEEVLEQRSRVPPNSAFTLEYIG